MSSVYGLNFWQYNGYFGDNMNRSEFGTADNDNASRGGHTYVEQEETTKSGCPAANAGSSGQTIGEPWDYINWQSNISDTYSRVWWGWFVPSYSGTLWLQTASDDSSLVYVSEDEFGQPTTSSSRTAVKTAAGGFSAITLVVNNGNTHGRTYKSGSMTVVAGKSYFIRIYMGENGGGDNMIFSWNDTGDPANSTSNTMSYVKLDGSQSDKVLFYINNPVQPKAGGGAPVDVSLGIISWYDGASYDTSNSVWTDKAGNIDLCGNRLVGNIKTKSYLVNDSTLVSNRNNKKYIQKSFPTYLSGDKNTGISFSYDPSSQFLTDGSYTFFHVARRDPSDVNQTGRVFDGSGVNWYSGFNDASSGVAKHENDSINTIDTDYGTNWVVSVDTPKYYRSVGYSDTSNGYYETSSGNRNDTNTTTPPISVHYGSNTFQTPISTGGVVTNYSNYSINTFLSSGTLNITRNTTADFLIVGGGGGGGGQTHIGGGGGAGGVVIATNQSLAAGSYNVVVGSGGGSYIAANITTVNGISESYNNGDDYTSYTFINSGTFTTDTSTIIDFILIGGGGGGGSEIGGGGGGGGVVIGTSQTINSGTYNITIGTGGNGGINGSTKIGSNGNDTTFNGFIAKGGGGGGYHAGSSTHALDGGSGGGCGADNGGKSNKGDSNQDNYSNSVNVTGYGNDGYGAAGNYGSTSVGGGGGGAGTVPTSEDGGDGISNDFKTGNAIYYGGGGGGGGWARNRGLGGLGGGGNSDTSIAADGDDGVDGLGGGGGGGGGGGKPGGDGGSGVVIIRVNTSSSGFSDNINGSDSTFNGFVAKGGGGGATGNYVDAIRSTDVSGGTESQYSIGDVTYQVHSFTQIGTNTLTITKPIIADYMLIGGGGGGRGRHGGGGGAGGVIIGTSQTLPIGTYSINIGSGGQGGDYSDANNTIGYDGSNTEIFGNVNLKAKGGGGGGIVVSTFVNIVNGDFSDETTSNEINYNVGDTFKNGEWRWGSSGSSQDLRLIRYRQNDWKPIYPNATSNTETNSDGGYYYAALIKSYGGYLEQQLTVVPGNTYNIKYWVGPRVNSNSAGSGSPPGSNQTVTGSANGCRIVLVEGSTQTELGAQTLNSALGANQYYNQYRQFSLPFTPTVTNPWVRFVQNHTDNGDAAVFFTNIELEIANELPSNNGNDGGSGGGATYGNSGGNSKYYTSFNISDIVSWSQKGNYIYGSDNNDRIGGYMNTSIPRGSIGMNDDGTIIAIGSEHHSSNSGHVRIFKFSNNTWSQMGQDINGGSGDRFGSTVSINGSGDRIIIGTNKSSGRYAAVYKWNNSSWSIMDSNITGPGGSSSDEAFGSSVDINNEGNIIAISAPNHSHSSGGSRCGLLKIYEWNGSNWNQKGTSIYGQDSDYMGKDISLSDDGLLVVTGGTNRNNGDDSTPGIVKIYYWNDTLNVPDWTQRGTDLIGENLSGGATAYYEIRSQMGGCGGLKLSGDGKTLSAHYKNNNDHHIRTFTWNGTAWVKDNVDLDGEEAYDVFGGAISMNNRGTLMVTGAIYYSSGSASGKVYIYKRENNAWIKIKEILGTGFTGSSVTMNSDGFVISYSSPNTNTNGTGRGTVTTYNSLDSLGNILGQETDLDGGSATISINLIAYGNDGGVGQDNGYWPSGGGGGAGGVGVSPSDNQQSPGDGGIGIQNSFLTNSNIYYAGGGGATSKLTDTGGSSGGSGGGGDGKSVGGGNGGDATANTGGGGGGGGGDAYRGGHGGSGYAVVRFAYNDLAEKGDADIGGSGGGGGGNYLAGNLPSTAVTGGTITSYQSGGSYYQVHTFTADGTLTVNSSVNVDFLIVGGGGGGAGRVGGGGGGGGVIVGTNQSLSNQTYSVVVGSGGNGGTRGGYGNSITEGETGSESSFNSFIAMGGGGAGGNGTEIIGNDGGSGGGGNYNNGNGGNAKYKNISGTITSMPNTGYATITTNVTAYGNDGGGARQNPSYPTGGGGGAGQVGETAIDNNSSPGSGGNGIQNNFKTGVNIYYGGGGGGSGYNGGYSAGGLGGGGSGRDLNNPPLVGENGTSELGGGGGSAGFYLGGDYFGANGGNGGSGVVIIRFVYSPSTTPSYPGGNDGTDGGSSSQDTYSSITNVTGYGNSGGGFTGIPASEGDDAGGGGGGAGGAGSSRSPNGGGTGNGGIGIQNDFRTNSLVYYAGGGGGGSGTSSTPGTGGSSLGGSGSNSSSDPGSAIANSGGGGGGGNSAVNGGNGADGIVVVRVTDSLPAQQCDWNVAEVISYNRILDSTEENKVFNYLKNKYLGTQQSSTSELYQLTGEIEGGDMIRGFPPEFPLHKNIIGWYTNDSYEYDTSGVWSDISPFRHNLTATLNNTPISSDAYTDKIEKKIDDIHPQLSYIKGNNEVGFNFPSSILPDSSYTLIYVARKPIDGTDVSGRIIDSKTNVNFYSGFIGTKTGVTFHST